MKWPAEVREVTRLAPHLMRLKIKAPGFHTNGMPDESVTLYFPGTEQGRNYTVRQADNNTVTIDFVRHGTGIASTWVEQARPGDTLVLWRQRGWYRPPAETDWFVLATDLTGLPAVARILSDHSYANRVTILLDAIDRTDLSYLDGVLGGATLDVRSRSGNGIGPSTLVDRMSNFVPPPGKGYIWFAGEASDARRARTLWRAKQQTVTSVGYWRADAENWERRYAAVAPEMDRLYQDCLDAGQSITAAGERVEAELERRGL